MNRIEEFTIDGKNFVLIDFSNLKTDIGYLELIDSVKPVIAKYPENSLHTITNIKGVTIDSNSKEITVEYLKHNKPYVRYGVIIGLDGVKKLIAETFMRLSGRRNLHFAFTKEKAVEWLLEQE